MKFYSQIGQDKYVLDLLKHKRDGFFIDIGCFKPKFLSNTYTLEYYFNWSGIGIDIEDNSEVPTEPWSLVRPNTIHIVQDALKINYDDLFKKYNAPSIIDYLSIDIDQPASEELLSVLPFNNYRFKVISFETDSYREAHPDLLCSRCRNVFEKHGYSLYCTLPEGRPQNLSQDDIWISM